MAALELTEGHPALADTGITMFTTAPDYQALEWVYLGQDILARNKNDGLWQCDLALEKRLRCPAGWIRKSYAQVLKVGILCFFCVWFCVCMCVCV